MATLPSFLSSSPSSPPFSAHHLSNFSSFSLSFPLSPHPPTYATFTSNPKRIPTLILASSNSASSFDDFVSDRNSCSPDKKSILSDLIQDIEPLDVSLIQRDVPPTTLDAMKRTISGMLGLLPSDRFKVLIEALWEPLSKLLVSSMMTGYTLRNAEYRLCLEKTLDVHERDIENQQPSNSTHNPQAADLYFQKRNQSQEKNAKSENLTGDPCDDFDIHGLGDVSPEAHQYILSLQSRLSSVKKELYEVKRKSASLQMQQFVGEEKNDLLDYLRSLKPEKVAELSEPTSPEVKEVIHSVVHGLLATLSPKMHSKLQSENSTSTGTRNVGSEDYTELVENTSLQFQPLISLTRDYLARLLFWCMLLGHHLRGLEYRMELMELMSLTTNLEKDDQVA